MNEQNPLAVLFLGIFKIVKVVVVGFAWIIIVLCVGTKNR